MPGWTLEEARRHLQAWLDADFAVAAGKSYRIGGRELTRADTAEVAGQIRFWSQELARMEAGRAGGARVIRVAPRDL